jgi:hypothetical protein
MGILASWKVQTVFAWAKGSYHTNSTRRRTNQGIRVSIQDFAQHIRKEDVRLITVNGSLYWMYRYEGGGAQNIYF